MAKIAASLQVRKQDRSPAGARITRTCMSKKKDAHVAGWCSDTEAVTAGRAERGLNVSPIYTVVDHLSRPAPKRTPTR